MSNDSAPNLPPFPSSYRASGLLLHVASLPSSYGIGDVGPAAIAWIDQLSDAGPWVLVHENEPGAPPVWHSGWPKLYTRPKRPPRGWRKRRHLSRIPGNLRHRQCPAYGLGTGRCGLRPFLETLTDNF